MHTEPAEPSITNYFSHCGKSHKEGPSKKRALSLIADQGENLPKKVIKKFVEFIGKQHARLMYTSCILGSRNKRDKIIDKIINFFKTHKYPKHKIRLLKVREFFGKNILDDIRALNKQQFDELLKILEGTQFENNPYLLDQLFKERPKQRKRQNRDLDKQDLTNDRQEIKMYDSHDLQEKRLKKIISTVTGINPSNLFKNFPGISETIIKLYDFYVLSGAVKDKISHRDKESLKKLHGSAVRWTTEVTMSLWLLPESIGFKQIEARISKSLNEMTKHRSNLVKNGIDVFCKTLVIQ